jgi:hypothetical protein
MYSFSDWIGHCCSSVTRSFWHEAFLPLIPSTDKIHFIEQKFLKFQVSPCRERAVLDQLSSYFTERISRYPTSLSEDMATVCKLLFVLGLLLMHWGAETNASFCNAQQLQDPATVPKRRVATQLVKIEKEILHSCLEIVNEYTDQLPDCTPASCNGPYLPKLK